ncbi:unnamed protein product [Ambrosiozyma monospora]|uniref:Unnamed protein product n=1 Tax=Ambrosiozyma monospora TaxID=43982 RepID=A0ACB5TWS6_AMBMO|nr:unnamed protein product [Ambrosiozyma monospora]
MSNSPARTTPATARDREPRDYNQLYMNILQTPKPVGHLVSSNGSTSNAHRNDSDVSIPSINVDSTAITATPPSSAARPPQISFGSVTPSVFNGATSNPMMLCHGTPSGSSRNGGNGTGANGSGNANGTLAIAMPTTPNSANMLPIPESLLLNTPNQPTSNSAGNGNSIPTSNPTNIKSSNSNNSESKSTSSSSISSSTASSASSSATKSTTSTSTSTSSTTTSNPAQRFPSQQQQQQQQQQQAITTPATPKNNNSRFFRNNQLDKTPGFSMSDYVNIFTPSPRLTKTPDFHQIQFQNLNQFGQNPNPNPNPNQPQLHFQQAGGQGQGQGGQAGQGQGHFMGGVVKPVVLMYSNGNGNGNSANGNGGGANSLDGILGMGVTNRNGNGQGQGNGQGSRNVSGGGSNLKC